MTTDARWQELRDTFLRKYKSVPASELAGADVWEQAGKIFSIMDGAHVVYPLFQIAQDAPHPVVGKVLEIFGSRLTPWQIAIWFTSTNPWLEDYARPVDLLDKPEAVLKAASREMEESVL